MNKPIIEGLQRYHKEQNIRFHMPGHKGKRIALDWTTLIPEIDVTEVTGTDNLHQPEAMIKESQDLAAKTFGAKATYYSVNGTTGGIYAAIMAVTRPGDQILVQRNCHKSVYNAMVLNDLKPLYIYPDYDEAHHMVLGVTPEAIDNDLRTYPNIKAVVLTYPTYYGICCNLESIAQVIHKHGKILIVDEAHGSHLTFSDRLPKSALRCGADLVVQSTHKTLPALTQSSMVHVGSHRVDRHRLKRTMALYQTTSPSYLLMASIDAARAYMENEGKHRIENLIDAIIDTTDRLRSIKGIKVFNGEQLRRRQGYGFDCTKLLINPLSIQRTGKQLEHELRQDYHIQLEMADFYYGLALTTVCDDTSDLDRLYQAVKAMAMGGNRPLIINGRKDFKSVRPPIEMSLKEAFNRETERMSLQESRDRIAGAFIIPYPPGIPVVCPGERLSQDVIDHIEALRATHIDLLNVFGEHKDKIDVLK